MELVHIIFVSIAIRRVNGSGIVQNTLTTRRIKVLLLLQGLKKSRDLHRDEVNLRVGNGAKVATLAVGSYCLSLPSGLLLNLNNWILKVLPL